MSRASSRRRTGSARCSRTCHPPSNGSITCVSSTRRRSDMDPRVFRRVQRYGWDAATNAYDRGWVPQLGRLTESCIARANLRSGERTLDLATGTGVGAFAAARAVGAAGSVTGIDVSEKMVTLAALRAANGRAANVLFERADMEATGAADGSFDAVTCAFGLMFAADRAAAFAETARVT